MKLLCAENSLHVFEMQYLVIYFLTLFPVVFLSAVLGMGAATKCQHFSQCLSTHIQVPLDFS